MSTNNEIKISVRNLVEFVLRSGDLDSRFRGSIRAVEGTKAHQKVQKASDDNYISEVTLKHTTEYNDILFIIEGRADGLIIDEDKVTIDEIKSTAAQLSSIDEDYNPLHWAQAMCYGYFYLTENNLNTIDIQLTYFQIETEEIKRFVKNFSADTLEEFFMSLLDKYVVWANFTRKWVAKRNESIDRLQFPFENYRKGQRKFAIAVYKTIEENKKLFVQAPTGTGKTISTLFPAIKAIEQGHSSKIFYLTAKTITRQVAQDTISLLKDNGLELKSVTITAKDKICFMDETICSPEHCQYAKGHFDRANDAILDILRNENMLTREVIEAYAIRHQVCPFEFSLDLSLWADVIICDYNYAFDPKVYLKRFFEEGNNNYIFLVDEAHNLLDRAREMFSVELYKKTFLELKKTMKEKNSRISKALGKLNSYMLEMKRACEDDGYFISKEEPAEIYPLLRKLTELLEEWLVKNEGEKEYKDLLQLYFDALIFLRIAELYNECFLTYAEKIGNDVKLKIYCIDPSQLLEEGYKRAKTSVFFSATLQPIKYYRETLGGKEDDYILQIPSPFDKDNLGLFIVSNISTKYKDRELSYYNITDYIYAVTKHQKGNYLIFFPSYHYMNNVHELFTEKYDDIRTIIQRPDLTEEERDLFLDEFQPNEYDSMVGFAVMGGVFSEGIDLKGTRLIGTIVVGVGLPQICLERDMIKDYFNTKKGNGYEYAYMYPGINKVLQAGGRVIRTHSDTGVVVLIDERFLHTRYKQIFPAEWDRYTIISSVSEIEKSLKNFWKRK